MCGYEREREMWIRGPRNSFLKEKIYFGNWRGRESRREMTERELERDGESR